MSHSVNLNKFTTSASLTWKPLNQLNFYRLVLASGLLIAFYKSDWIVFLGSQNPKAFLDTAHIFLFSSLFFIFINFKTRLSFETHIIISNISDIILITLLTHFSGGLSSSLSILLIINVTATGTFLPDKQPYLFAALATIALFSEQTTSIITGVSNESGYSQAGLLGLVFFGISFLASILSKRMRESEQLAIAREADIINLERLNDDIIQNMRTGILVVDNIGHIRMANSSAESLLGNISLQHQPTLEKIQPGLNTRFIEWQDQPHMHHQAIPQEQGLPDIQPGFRKLQSTDKDNANTLIFLEDATQLNQRFQQIKLTSLGRLTASIAHEIRNPLSAINHAAQLLEEAELPLDDKKLATIITAQVRRLDKVLENVLQLSRQHKNSTETIEIKPWMEHFCDEFILSSHLKKSQIKLEIINENIIVLFDSSHLNQVMTNLCNNAIIHNHHDLNEVSISITCHHDIQYNQPIIDVIDNGPGISKQTIEQIFDPFFTTSTKGTGLGLYISKEIIETNRAKIRYLNTKNNGGCFRIHLLAGN